MTRWHGLMFWQKHATPEILNGTINIFCQWKINNIFSCGSNSINTLCVCVCVCVSVCPRFLELPLRLNAECWNWRIKAENWRLKASWRLKKEGWIWNILVWSWHCRSVHWTFLLVLISVGGEDQLCACPQSASLLTDCLMINFEEAIQPDWMV